MVEYFLTKSTFTIKFLQELVDRETRWKCWASRLRYYCARWKKGKKMIWDRVLSRTSFGLFVCINRSYSFSDSRLALFLRMASTIEWSSSLCRRSLTLCHSIFLFFNERVQLKGRKSVNNFGLGCYFSWIFLHICKLSDYDNILSSNIFKLVLRHMFKIIIDWIILLLQEVLLAANSFH